MRRKQYNLPSEFTDRLTKQFGSSKVALILQAFSAKRDVTFRTNTLKSTDEEVMSFLRNNQILYERIKTIPHAHRVRKMTNKELLKMPLFTEGKAYMQGETSMLPAFLLDPQPGETVLDLCAAPGGKTTQMAAMMKNQGRLVACEDNGVRFQKLEHIIKLQGAANVEAIHQDACLIHKEMPETFDKILADVPCSAEGRINIDAPRTFGFWSLKNIIAHAKLQRRLLRSAVACLKPGGTLVYSTCTLAPEENELMIAWLQEEFREMKLVEPAKLSIPTKEREGFFVAKLKKQT